MQRALVGLVCLVLVVVASFVGSPVCAQEQPPIVEPTDAQMQLYDKAAAVFAKEEFDRAVRLFQAALYLGELNMLYLNMGRAYYRLGKCKEAEEAFAKVEAAPSLAHPSPAEIKLKLESYRKDLQYTCPGVLDLRCEQAGMTVSIDGAPDQTCGAIPLDPGEHSVVAKLSGKTNEVIVNIEPRKTKVLPLRVDLEGDGPDVFTVVGWGATGLGSALILSAVLVNYLSLAPQLDAFEEALVSLDPPTPAQTLREDIETTQSAVLLLGISGAVITAGGVVLLLLSGEETAPTTQQPGPPSSGLDIWASPESTGVRWTHSW